MCAKIAPMSPPLATGEFAAEHLLLAGRVIDRGQLSPVQLADLERLVVSGRATRSRRRGKTFWEPVAIRGSLEPRPSAT